jgi:hypothetical protein
VVLLSLASLMPAVAPRAASAQLREVRGRLQRGATSGSVPVAGAWVTLHRVGKDRAGPIDSVRTDRAGRYLFAYRPTGDSAAVYFLSSRHGGIAYFTQPLRKPLVTGDEAGLFVYDTTSAPIPIRVRGHHLVITAPDTGRGRRVVEVYELSNDSTVTRVAGLADRATFETLLPDGARDARSGDGDITPDAVTFARGRVRVVAPLAPGVKQLSFNYRLPLDRDPLTFAITDPAAVLEVLIEDPKGTAGGAGLNETQPASVEGRRFRRFLAQDVAANAAVRVTAPTRRGSEASVRVALLAMTVGVALLVLVARFAYGRGPLATRTRSGVTEDPDALARRIAALDAAFESRAAPTVEQRADHYEERARLKARLAAAIAARDGLAWPHETPVRR